MCETEFFEEDHGAGVGVYCEGFNFCFGEGECGKEEEEDEGDVEFRHC